MISIPERQASMRSKLTILLMLIIFTPNVSAAIDSKDGGGELWFSCNDINDCSLTEFHTGEESISGTVNSATPFSPKNGLPSSLLNPPIHIH